MKRSIQFLFAFLCGFILVSCENNVIDDNKTEIPESKVLEFIYQGNTYRSTYSVVNDTIMVIDNQEVANTYSELMNMSELATFVHDNGIEEYFENAEIALANLIPSTKEVELPELRYISTIINGDVLFMDRANLQGQGMAFPISISSFNQLECKYGSMQNTWSGPPFTQYNFNDKPTSVKVSATTNPSIIGFNIRETVLTLYENCNYKGKSITFKSTGLNLQVNNLNDYKMQNAGLFQHSKTWDKRVSSFKVNFVKY